MRSSQLPMRRFENGSHDPKIIQAILDQISIVHVGCFDEEYPYVVPLSFGYEIKEDTLLVYLHGAREGHKVDLWEKNPHVALTFSMFNNYPDHAYRGNIHDYRSVMALGTIKKADLKNPGNMHGRGFQSLLKHNQRKPNQFSVPHYMWMAVYVVTCRLEDVVAKMENPTDDPAEIPFVDVYNVPENHEPYDLSYFYHRKEYKKIEGDWVTVNTELPYLRERENIVGDSIDIILRWKLKEGYENDLDILALVTDKEGNVPRRYDMAFYNQSKDRSHMVTHLGDDRCSQRKGEETIHLDANLVPEYFGALLVNLSCFNEEALLAESVEFVQMTVIASDSKNVLVDNLLDFSKAKDFAKTLIEIHRNEHNWEIIPVEKTYRSWKILDQAQENGLNDWFE